MLLVTRLQIVQFLFSGMCFGGTLYMHHILNYNCRGMHVVYASLCFNATLLYGFVDVLQSGKKRPKQGRAE
jgi:hypothetical protein